MTVLPWNSDIVAWFVNHRLPWLTSIFQFFTFLGGEQGYILLIIIIYWTFSKRVAIRVVYALLFSALLNQTLKIFIRNPRPFVIDGTYQQNWAVSSTDATELAQEFSTPSGHAQSSSTFWWMLHLDVKSRVTFILLPVMVLLIGISRVYLGVHFLEDVILGWVLGFLVVVFVLKIENRISSIWTSTSRRIRVIAVFLLPSMVWIVAGVASSFNADGQTFATLGGLITGTLLGIILDEELQFNPSLKEYNGFLQKVVIIVSRIVIGLIPIVLSLIGLDVLFGLISGDDSFLGFLFRYLRYGAVGLSGTYLAPLIFTKLKLTK